MLSYFQKHCFVYVVNPVVLLSNLTDGDDEDGEDEDSQGHPGHIGLEAPGLSKIAPTLIHPWSHF